MRPTKQSAWAFAHKYVEEAMSATGFDDVLWVNECSVQLEREGREPGAGRGSDDTQLEHVLELTLCSLEPFGCESSGASRDGRTSGLNVVTDIVSHGCVWRCDLSEGQELRSAR